jgi:microcystin-dependent protein
MDGVTSTAAELNILDGATLTTTELNYVDGVTSAVQTQLNTVTASLANNTPVGAVTMWVTGTAPTGWVLCQGQELPIEGTYSALAGVLSTTYGNLTNGSGGVGTSHFRLPDLRGRIPIGAGTGIGGGVTGTGRPTGGAALTARTLGGFTGDERLHAHNHPITDPGHTHPVIYVDGGVVGFNDGGNAYEIPYSGGGGNPIIAGNNVTSITVNNNTQGGLSENIQPSTVLNFIIKF